MPSTTSYRPGDFVLVSFPYTTGARSKYRPALVILDARDGDVLVARVTTQLYGTRYDVTVADWQISGLLAPSVVRLHKLATLNQSLFGRVLGHVSATDRRRIGAVMRSIYGRW